MLKGELERGEGQRTGKHIYVGENTRAETLGILSTNRKRKNMGIRRLISSTPCLIFLARVERSLLKSTSGASKFIGVLDRTSTNLQSKLGGCMSVKTKLVKRLQSVGCIDDLAHT
eukprot:357053-Pelagomonas_calceolata.AAC.1